MDETGNSRDALQFIAMSEIVIRHMRDHPAVLCMNTCPIVRVFQLPN